MLHSMFTLTQLLTLIKTINNMKHKVLQHTMNNPDLAPSDIHLSELLKEA